MTTDPSLTQPLSDEEIFAAHERGKITVESTRPLETMRDLAINYSPGVARVSQAIADDPSLKNRYTSRANTVAVVSDGTAVLGLGKIGPAAAMPVMEGKAQLFNQFAGLNAIPIVLDTTDTDEIVATITAIAPSFGAINLEDIAAPRCFDIEHRLVNELDMPVMHDDQHGTAVVILAALRNACELFDRQLSDLRVVVSGAGAAGIASVNMLIDAGVTDIVVLDSQGVIHADRNDLTDVKRALAARTNPRNVTGGVAEAFLNADTFIGVSRGSFSEDLVKTMADKPFLFSLANPDPEIDQEVAQRYGGVVATGRSDLPNQINNVLAFPGIFRGALDAGATEITTEMKLAASTAIADLVENVTVDYIVPSAMDRRVATAVAEAVAAAWRDQST